MRGHLSPAEFLRERAAYLADGEAPEPIAQQLGCRDHALNCWTGPIALWFEHDLYDQLQLIQALARLASRDDVWLVPQADFIGHQGPESLRDSWQGVAPVTGAQRREAKQAWEAFSGSDPSRFAGLNPTALPHLRAAIDRWIATFPDDSGLARTERQVLQILRAGPASGAELFRTTTASEEAAFRGDWSFWRLLDAMGPGLLTCTAMEDAGPADRVFELTNLGADVLAGRADRVEAFGLDTWRGGTHLTPFNDWRAVGGERTVRLWAS